MGEEPNLNFPGVEGQAPEAPTEKQVKYIAYLKEELKKIAWKEADWVMTIEEDCREQGVKFNYVKGSRRLYEILQTFEKLYYAEPKTKREASNLITQLKREIYEGIEKKISSVPQGGE